MRACGVVYFRLWRKISFGLQDLVIDQAARTVRLPLTYKRRKRMQYAFSEIDGVLLQKVARHGKSRVTYTYAPALAIAGQNARRLTNLSQKRAESFAEWLRGKLGVAEGVKEAENSQVKKKLAAIWKSPPS